MSDTAHAFLPLASVLANAAAPVNSSALTRRHNPQSLLLIEVNLSRVVRVPGCQPAALGAVSGAGSKHAIDSYKMWVTSVKVTAQMMNLSVPASYK